jgi:putative acetyltransferase
VAANEDDRPVAYIDLEPNGHIDRLFCAPEAAGQGIASRLYDAVEAAAREQGIRSLFTEASELARRLFERKGLRGSRTTGPGHPRRCYPQLPDG